MYGREWEFLKEIRERDTKDQNAPFASVPRVDRVGHTWTEEVCPRVAQVAHTWATCHGLLPILASRTLCVLRAFSGLRTPISNPSLDYES